MQSRLHKIQLKESTLRNYLIPVLFNSSVFDKLKNTDSVQFYKILGKLKPYSIEVFPQWRKFDKINLEFCCGVGDFITKCAAENKEQFFIGIDIVYSCVQRAIQKAEKKQLSNILFYCGSGNDFLWDFQNFFFDVLMINFPDPWPKKRHVKRRIINDYFLDLLLKVMKQNSKVVTCTDVENLYNYHLEIFLQNQNLKQLKEKTENLVNFYSNNISSYQKKNLAKSDKIFYTIFEKKC